MQETMAQMMKMRHEKFRRLFAMNFACIVQPWNVFEYQIVSTKLFNVGSRMTIASISQAVAIAFNAREQESEFNCKLWKSRSRIQCEDAYGSQNNVVCRNSIALQNDVMFKSTPRKEPCAQQMHFD